MKRLLVFLLGAAAAPTRVLAFVPIAPTTTSRCLSMNPSSAIIPNNVHRSSAGKMRSINANNIISVGGGRRSTSSYSSSTALAALPLPKIAAVGATIAKFYKAFPLIAGFLTAGTKAAFADSMAQYRDVCTTKFDAKRNLAMVLYSGLVLGMSVEIMYNKCFPVIFGSGAVDLVKAIKMTLFDGFINAPLLWLPPAYIAQAIVYQYPKRDAINKYITDVKENGLLKKYWSLWIPASMINFLFIPKHFRVAFVAGVSFFWMIVLSIVANNGEDPESCPVEPEPALKNPRALD